jgi:hypothetical protein
MKQLLLPKKVNKIAGVKKAANAGLTPSIQSASMLPPPTNKSDRMEIRSSIKKAIRKTVGKKKKS